MFEIFHKKVSFFKKREKQKVGNSQNKSRNKWNLKINMQQIDSTKPQFLIFEMINKTDKSLVRQIKQTEKIKKAVLVMKMKITYGHCRYENE